MSREQILTQTSDWLHGDDAAFEMMFYHYQPRVYRYVFKYLHNRTEAEDITTDVLVRVWQKRAAILSADTFESYLFTIARNSLVSAWRKHIDLLLSTDYPDLPAAETDAPVYKELEASYHQSLSSLPEQRRKIFLLHREENLTYQEIADQLHISPKTVENQIGATLRHLRTTLSHYLTTLL